ncbi:MAG: anhydro-N-acetylmuramic acid kinase [SAR86 cluster bacterium]|uniref:Anhydro-N-acetylmuramic acid kinase n=1 Tax=SAR86 cluster bacterium TaxID=2030880 RepID=A0A2A5CGA6_9GAMM|nr:MAG: anhydro-N-acetylmuramic acid kinase [SAR86 cluster bacterium]
MSSELYIGLMSGTSMDAVDCVLADLSDALNVIDFINVDIPARLKKDILDLCLESGDNQIKKLGETDVALGKLFASAAISILEKNQLNAEQIQAIGSHGQTIRHQPPGQSDNPFTIQIGDPNTIAALTGITTVADFRRKDMALGGQGAPLLPAFHQRVLKSTQTDRIILNIGGMANITLLRKEDNQITGFDTGPGNILLDIWIQENLNQSFDNNGDWAASGKPNAELLEFMLNDPYFSSPPPKSTGREYFNNSWIANVLSAYAKEISPQDVQATLLELAAISIAQAIKNLIGAGDVIVCGGGVKNKQLMHCLETQLDSFNVSSSNAYGIDSDALEAFAFAWFAKQTINRESIDFTNITGSSRPVILGGIYSP